MHYKSRILASGVHKFIERANVNNDLEYVLQSEEPYPYLQEFIQKHGAAELPPSSGAEEDALRSAYEYLRGKITSVLSDVDDDTSVPKKQKQPAKIKELVKIRDKILRLNLICVLLDNEDDAYLIFETLNTRGKDLTVSDLVKTYLTRMLKPTNKGVDVARDKWRSMLELFDAASVEIDVNRFLHHSWLSRHEYTTEKKLFKEIKSNVDRNRAKEFLRDCLRISIPVVEQRGGS